MRYYVGPFCRRKPYNARHAEMSFNASTDVYRRNYAPRGGWDRGIDKDLIDHKALKDSTLTRRENTRNVKHMFDFRNLRI